jgi:hypothetical protein
MKFAAASACVSKNQVFSRHAFAAVAPLIQATAFVLTSL